MKKYYVRKMLEIKKKCKFEDNTEKFLLNEKYVIKEYFYDNFKEAEECYNKIKIKDTINQYYQLTEYKELYIIDNKEKIDEKIRKKIKPYAESMF